MAAPRRGQSWDPKRRRRSPEPDANGPVERLRALGERVNVGRAEALLAARNGAAASSIS
ncbi:Hypothetical protein A7982_05562 [Minicystis rosea]|nr:Hypothetical protein A7982_05562 [Minicystis rosea]